MFFHIYYDIMHGVGMFVHFYEQNGNTNELCLEVLYELTFHCNYYLFSQLQCHISLVNGDKLTYCFTVKLL